MQPTVSKTTFRPMIGFEFTSQNGMNISRFDKEGAGSHWTRSLSSDRRELHKLLDEFLDMHGLDDADPADALRIVMAGDHEELGNIMEEIEALGAVEEAARPLAALAPDPHLFDLSTLTPTEWFRLKDRILSEATTLRNKLRELDFMRVLRESAE